MKDGRHLLAYALCLLVPVGGVTGCFYEDPEPVRTAPTGLAPVHMPSAGGAPESASFGSYSDSRVLEREAQNYGELSELLEAVPGPVLLFEVGPLDGPLRGFGTTEKVLAAGQYTVTAACVGASDAKVSVGQEHPGAPFRPEELSLDCTGATSQVIALQQGYLFAHLSLPSPGDTPWTGAVGGVRVTRNGCGTSRGFLVQPLAGSLVRLTNRFTPTVD